MSLQRQLEEFAQYAARDVSKDTLQILQQAAQALQEKQLTANAVKIGDTVRDFSLPNATGESVTLKMILKNGPAVLSFYRGAWCPFCNLELIALQKILPQIQTLGASLLAISPQLPDKSLSLVEKHKLNFQVLSDTGNRVARDFGLVYEVDKALIPIFEDWGIHLKEYNGDKSSELPVPSTIIVDRNGTVVYTFHDTDYSKRMEPQEIVTKLECLEAQNIRA